MSLAAASFLGACAGRPENLRPARVSAPQVQYESLPPPLPPAKVFQAATLTDTPGWVRVQSTGAVTLRIAYATPDNIAGRALYDCPACLLRPRVADALEKAVRAAAAEDYGIVLFDCYRPTSAQEALYRALNNPRYVAAPGRGSAHNRGCAVDVGLTRDGALVDMGSGFDEMTPRSAYAAAELTASQRAARKTLRGYFERAGFKPYDAEWWHFSIPNCGEQFSDYRWPCSDTTQP